MKIFISSDHAGFKLKQHLVKYLEEHGFEVVDTGPAAEDHADDYPDLISLTAEAVSKDPQARGIVLGYSGQGEAMVANKFKNVRAVVYYGGDKEILTLSREHNDANILSLGAKNLSPEEAEQAVDVWIETPFTRDPRHKRRIDKISAIELRHMV